MRRALLLLVLVGCGWDTVDLDDSTKPNRVTYCTKLAHQTADGLYDDAIYQICMHGHAATADAGQD